MTNLQEPPDHRELEHGADAPRRDDERVGGEHELV